MTETILLITALVFYLLSLILQLTVPDRKQGQYALFLAVSVHLGLLAVRSAAAGHPPFTNIYETFLLLPFLTGLRLILWPKQADRPLRAILTGVAGAFLLVALFLPGDLKAIKPLMPALNSFWMYIHVPAYFLGYMALIVALVYALMILFARDEGKAGELERKMETEIRITFFFLNLGLVTGAIWAYVSWGNYWSWDPKETWALINILILAFVLHLQRPNAEKKAWIVILTAFSVAFTYWGVSFILSGLHSYT